MGPRLVGLELESELGAMELVEPSLNPFASIIHLCDILLSICIAVFLPSPYFQVSFGGGVNS